jgi:cell division protein FtsL
MRDLTLSLPLGASSKRKSVSVNHSRKINTVLLASIVILGFGYLFQINALGTTGYEIKKIEKRLQTLEQEQKSLQLDASDLQSIDRVQAEAMKMNFVPSENVTYLKDPNFALK